MSNRSEYIEKTMIEKDFLKMKTNPDQTIAAYETFLGVFRFCKTKGFTSKQIVNIMMTALGEFNNL